MKIGSVKFFKVLIVSVYLLLVLVPIALAVTFGVLYSQQKGRFGTLEAENETLYLQMQAMAPGMELPEPELMRAGDAAAEGNTPELSLAYQALYPDMVVTVRPAQTAVPKTCYLTFDDGPSAVTQRVLDALDECGVKATFFVTGKGSEENPELLRAAVRAGHTVGVHSYSHEYETIYASVEAFLEDFYEMYTCVKEITGVAPTVFRFPGGSINSYNGPVYQQVIAEMMRRGFVFYDWNAAASDAVSPTLSREEIVQNVLHSAGDQERLIVLLHDRGPNSSTAAALPEIITQLQARGFTFAALDNSVLPICYAYPE